MTIRLEARRFARGLALFGARIENNLPFHLKDDPRTQRLTDEDRSEIEQIAQAVYAQMREQEAFFAKMQKFALRVWLVTDLIVGAVVAGVAKYHPDNQFVLIIGWLAAIQLLLSLAAYYWIKYLVNGLFDELGVADHERSEIADTMLAGTRQNLWFNFPIRIVEFFAFVCLFLLIYSLYAVVAGLGPVEQFAHEVFDQAATLLYGTNQTPQERMITAVAGLLLSTGGGWLMQKLFPVLARAGSTVAISA